MTRDYNPITRLLFASVMVPLILMFYFGLMLFAGTKLFFKKLFSLGGDTI